MTTKAKRIPLLDPSIAMPAIADSFRKLDPRTLIRNPVMFAVEIVAAVSTLLFIRDLLGNSSQAVFTGQITAWLWFTVLFANFAEAVAEGPRQGPGRDLAQDAHRYPGQSADAAGSGTETA